MPVSRYQAGVLDCTTPLNLETLTGKSVVLTGGATGLGREYVQRFVAAGAHVTFGDIKEAESTALVAEFPGNVQFVKCDVRSWEDQVQLFETAIAKSPSKSCDIVIANAGILTSDTLQDQADPNLPPVKPDTSLIEIDLIGVVYTAKLAIHCFRRQGDDNTRDRCLILKGSLGGYLDQAGAPFYSASKFAVRGLMHSLRRTSWLNSIRVNLVSPWIIETPLMNDKFVQFLASRGIKFALKEDACTAVLRIASDQSINGRSLAIVHRDDCPQGYLDLDQDDFPEDSLLGRLQDAALNANPLLIAAAAKR